MPVNHCQIHLTDPARRAAAAATNPWPDTSAMLPHEAAQAQQACLRNQDVFTGPHFHGIKNIAVSEGTVDVVLPDGTVYMYPLHSVARVKVYTTEE